MYLFSFFPAGRGSRLGVWPCFRAGQTCLAGQASQRSLLAQWRRKSQSDRPLFRRNRQRRRRLCCRPPVGCLVKGAEQMRTISLASLLQGRKSKINYWYQFTFRRSFLGTERAINESDKCFDDLYLNILQDCHHALSMYSVTVLTFDLV